MSAPDIRERVAREIERFWDRVYPDPNTGCWLWLGAPKDKGRGYGTLRVEGRSVYAHRFSYELHRGPIPDGLGVLHRCDVHHCVTPDHLFLGTQADNNRDRDQKGRHAVGHKNGRAKLTWEKVREIRRRAGTVSAAALGREFGVGDTAIGDIIHGRRWRTQGREGR